MAGLKNFLKKPVEKPLALGEYEVVLGAVTYVPADATTNRDEHFEIPMMFPNIINTAGVAKTKVYSVYTEKGMEIFCNQIASQLNIEVDFAEAEEFFKHIKGKTFKMWYTRDTKVLEDGTINTYYNYNFTQPKNFKLESTSKTDVATDEDLPM